MTEAATVLLVLFSVSVFLAPAFDAYSNAVTEIATGDSKFD